MFGNKHEKKRMIALDAELDGMRPSRIIQLSYLIIDGRRIRGEKLLFLVEAINRHARKCTGWAWGSCAASRGATSLPTTPTRSIAILRNAAWSSATTWRATCAICATNLPRIGVKFPDIPRFCTLQHYTKEANIPLKQNPSKLKPPRLED